jgi:hypothetical protein
MSFCFTTSFVTKNTVSFNFATEQGRFALQIDWLEVGLLLSFASILNINKAPFLNKIEIISRLVKVTCKQQITTVVLAANPFFFLIALKSCLHPLSYYDKPLSHCDNGHSSYFCDHYNSISTEVFTTASVKTLLSLIRLSSSLVDT